MSIKQKRSWKGDWISSSADNLDVFIERLRRMRAMNDDPSLIGMDNFILRQLNLKSSNIIKRTGIP